MKQLVEQMREMIGGVEEVRDRMEALDEKGGYISIDEELIKDSDNSNDSGSGNGNNKGKGGVVNKSGMILEKLAEYDLEQLEKLRRDTLIAIARKEDNEVGFSAFYEIVVGEKMPWHCYEWIKAYYKARNSGRGIVIKAFRGSRKTTVMTILNTVWRIGREPTKTNLLIQVGDDIAMDNSRQIGDIIENNIGFREVFPYVRPDPDAGWGAGGYTVKRVDINYNEWRRMMVGVKDPTFIGLGYKSREIIGKHPTGELVIDDINDENNTSSKKELRNVLRILQDTIFPTIMAETMVTIIGTPWVEDDVINYVASTGNFDVENMPAYVVVGDDVVEDDVVELWGQRVKLMWKEGMSAQRLVDMRNLVGERGFARMYQLELRKMGSGFKYYDYPAASTRYDWEVIGGVDYAGVGNIYRNLEEKNDYFALCYLAKLPDGGAVVIDGVLERCTQAEAEAYVIRGQNLYPNWRYAVIETDGSGEQLFQILRRHPGLKLIPTRTKGRSKADRFNMGMAPWLENGMVKISDAETPFLAELRRELESYPNSEHDDAMDALYTAMRGMPEVLTLNREVGDEVDEDVVKETKRRNRNPFSRIGTMVRGR